MDRQQHIKSREDTFTLESITDVIRHRTLRWFGHVAVCKEITSLSKHINKTSKDSRKEEDH